jgi:large subunit ribosomal protein LP1
MANPELACVYASLILNDDGLPVDAAKLTAILTAANIHVDAPWVNIFAKSFGAIDISQYANSSCLGGGGGAGGGGAAPEVTDSAAAAPVAEAPKEEKKEEEAVLELADGFDDLFG